jgi:transcription-repair coupling factor (superfamily II helicase)
MDEASRLVPQGSGPVKWYGLTQPACAYLVAELQRVKPRPYLVYLPTPVEAEDFVRNLEFFWPEGAKAGAILLLPGYEIKPFSGESPSPELVSARLWALYNLLSDRTPLVVVTSAPGALQLSLPKNALSRFVEIVEAGEEVDRESLVNYLVRSGYYSTTIVQSRGDFSVRGGIMDVYPPGTGRPVRAEFFGDYVESLRSFRTLDQRSVDDLREQIILPINEIVYQASASEMAASRLSQLARNKGWLDLLWSPLVEKIGQEQYFPGVESFLPLFYDSLSSVQDYAGPEVVRLFIEPDRLISAADKHIERLESHLELIKAEERPHLPLESLYQRSADIRRSLDQVPVVEVEDIGLTSVEDRHRTHYFTLETNEDLKGLVGYSQHGGGMLAPLAARIKSWLSRDLEVTLTCHTKEQSGRLNELLTDYDLTPDLENKESRIKPVATPGFRIKVGFITSGFVFPLAGKAYVTEDELFGPKRRVVRRASEEIKGIHLSSFQDLGVGDFVVHNDHGIGQYLGLVKLQAGGEVNDYMHISYKGGDKLYVPVDRFGSVGKYIGADDKAPALDKLGGSSWERVKARIKASIRETAEELLKLYATRQINQGHAFTPRDSYFREFEASFAYEETPDQMAAIDEVLQDMASKKPMDRLVCGDVGYGKTEVALRAAFIAIADNRQVAVLVPTTVLAEQHYQTFSQRLQNYPITVQALSRFKKRPEQKEILSQLAQGGVDLVVGTHRLLQKDIKFKDLGLLIIDEEHRFGVVAKEKLKKLRTEVDVLTLSATPIPRTLQMSLTGIRDLSVIETPPQDRLSIKTYLLKYDEPTVCEAIARELERGGQVFFVHNRVKDIDLLAGRLKSLMPLVRFGVAHGQQNERDLEDVMLKFLHREIDVLVTTTIIESGLDFPSANTIIINNADRFGLAQIYQLRGRVGRSNEQAYAYLLVASAENLTRDSRKRLRALLDFSDLGAGFKIALHDLQIRGAGNLLGAAQSGQIAAVGYEMYVELMERTMRELKGEEVLDEVEPEMVLGIPAYIPESYIQDTEQRLIHYRRLSSVSDAGEIESVQAELLDRYGPAPQEVENLLQVMELKHWLKKVKVKKLELGSNGMTLTFVDSGPADLDKVLALVRKYPEDAKLSPEGRLFMPSHGLDSPEGLKGLKNILQGLS